MNVNVANVDREFGVRIGLPIMPPEFRNPSEGYSTRPVGSVIQNPC